MKKELNGDKRLKSISKIRRGTTIEIIFIGFSLTKLSTRSAKYVTKTLEDSTDSSALLLLIKLTLKLSSSLRRKRYTLCTLMITSSLILEYPKFSEDKTGGKLLTSIEGIQILIFPVFSDIGPRSPLM